MGVYFRETFARRGATIGPVQFLQGLLVGLALVVPIGPVSLTLIGVGAEKGRRAGMAGAAGIALADALLVGITAFSADRLVRLGTGWVRPTEVGLGILVGVLGLLAVVRAESARALVGRVERPTPTFLALTLTNPLSLALWAGVVLTLPPAMRSPAALLVFGAGIVTASALWHVGLGAFASWLGGRLTDRARSWSPRVAGLTMLVVAGVLVL